MMKRRATEEELTIVRQAMRQEKKVRAYRRYQALYLFLSGKTGREAAEISGLTSVTVSNIYRAYEKTGIEALRDKEIPGRPSRMSHGQQEELRKELADWENGYSLQRVVSYIHEKYGLMYTVRGVRMLLDRLKINN